VLSQSILYELEEVLQYPRVQKLYALTDAQIRRYIDVLAGVAEIVDLGRPIELPLADRDDWAILRTAIEGSVDVICSSDGGFHKELVITFCAQYGIRVLKPPQLLDFLSQP
jgi:putative PIN family toxin of toxin-antitoxin system